MKIGKTVEWLDPDVDEQKFVEKYYDALPPWRKAEIVLQVVQSIEQRIKITEPDWLSYIDWWELDLLHSILWQTNVPFSGIAIADEIWACLLSAGVSARRRFRP